MKKAFIAAYGLVAVLASCLGWVLHEALNAPASVSEVSPLGGYLIESVPVGGMLAPLGGLADLRIIDRQNPDHVFRSPLYLRQSVDIRVTEDERSLGVTWIEFDKHQRRFTLSIPQWRPDWRNTFISNTPYGVLPNG